MLEFFIPLLGALLTGRSFPNLLRKFRCTSTIDCVLVYSSTQKAFSAPVAAIFIHSAPLVATDETKRSLGRCKQSFRSCMWVVFRSPFRYSSNVAAARIACMIIPNCVIQNIRPCSWWWTSNSFETCRTRKNGGIKIIYRVEHLVVHLRIIKILFGRREMTRSLAIPKRRFEGVNKLVLTE